MTAGLVLDPHEVASVVRALPELAVELALIVQHRGSRDHPGPQRADSAFRNIPDQLDLRDVADRLFRVASDPDISRSVVPPADPPIRVFACCVKRDLVRPYAFRLASAVSALHAAFSACRSTLKDAHVLWIQLAPQWPDIRVEPGNLVEPCAPFPLVDQLKDFNPRVTHALTMSMPGFHRLRGHSP